MQKGFKSAFVAIVGRPSSGKSTLLNRLCAAKVSIVSPVPQTTRNSIRGIVNRERGQIVFIDTPGIHISGKKLNERLLAAARRTLSESDLVLYIIDAAREAGAEEEAVCALIQAELCTPKGGGSSSESAECARSEECADSAPPTKNPKIFAAINKIDVKSASVEAARSFLAEKLPALDAGRIFSISALNGEGVEALLDALLDGAAEGEAYYDGECYTDQDLRFRLSEIIREKCFLFLRDELPHCIYVDIEDVELHAAKAPSAREGGGAQNETLFVRARIRTEKESQKGIVVGAGGGMIKKIRLAALKDMRKIFDWKIELDLRVKASPLWRKNDAVLKTLY